MGRKKGQSFDDVFARFEHDEDFQRATRKIKPFNDLVVDVITLRNRLGLTQKELARRAKTYQSRISKIESGEHDVRLSTLIQIAEALNAEVAIKLIPLEWKAKLIPEDEVYYGQILVEHKVENAQEYSEEPAEPFKRTERVFYP